MLSAIEREYIIELMENGQEIPEDFKNKIFPIKNTEYEISYAGKMRKEDIMANEDGSFPVPLQIEKTYNESPDGSEWKNLLVFGDNLQFLKTIYKNDDPVIKNKVKGNVKLVYIDPPFATTYDFNSSEGAKAYTDKKKAQSL